MQKNSDYFILSNGTHVQIKKGDNNDKGLYRQCVTGRVVNNGPMYFTCGHVWEYIVTMRNREFKVCSKHIEDPESLPKLLFYSL